MVKATNGTGVLRGVHVSECESTQDLARARLADGGAGAGVVVVADHQTGGRGRQGRSWVSLPGAALQASVGLRGPLDPALLPDLAVRVAHELAEVLGQFGASGIEFKHPNDLLVQGRKLAGVLADAQTTGNTVDWVIVGVGVNLAGEPFDAGGTPATTFAAEFGAAPAQRVLARSAALAIASLCLVEVGDVEWELDSGARGAT